jgi:predicted MFS family arabinose efflux permease
MGSYRSVLGHGRLGLLFAVAAVARLPIGINGLAVILFLREETGSFRVPGLVAGGLALGIAVGAPVMGRLVDRRGLGVLLPLAVADAVALIALLVLGSGGAPTAALVAVAFAAGGFFPPSPSVLRARFPVLLRDAPELIPSAYALDAVLLELNFVAGPVLVTVIVATLGAAASLVLSAAAVLIGVSLFVWAMPVQDDASVERRSDGWLGVLRSPAVRTLVVTMLPIGAAIGAVQVIVPAFARDESHPELAGVLLAGWSIASAIGGLTYGARVRAGSLRSVHLWLTLALPVALAPLLVVASLPAMALLLLPAGLLIAPIIATRNELASEAAPPGTETEALTWPLTALVGGLALGAALGGALIDESGWRAAVVFAVASAALGGLVAAGRRGSLGAVAAVGRRSGS